MYRELQLIGHASKDPGARHELHVYAIFLARWSVKLFVENEIEVLRFWDGNRGFPALDARKCKFDVNHKLELTMERIEF